MAAGMTFYEIAWYFVMYSFLGWVVEVAYHAVTQGKVVNRGFLAGPVCPVYGFGAIIVFGVIDMIAGTTAANIGDANAGIIFFAGMLLASAVEYIGGWGLYHAFHARWWDYRDKPFNLGGYICLEFSIYWGLGALLVVRILHPVIHRISAGLVPESRGWFLLLFLYLIYSADSVVTILIVMGLNKRLAELDDLRASLRIVSDDLSERIGTQTLESMQRIDETRVQAALARAELRDAVEAENARRRHEAALARAALRNAVETENARRRHEMEERARQLRTAIEKRRVFGARRLMKAFPNLTYDSKNFEEIMQELREEIGGGKPRKEP